jgi:hypothetical protein
MRRAVLAVLLVCSCKDKKPAVRSVDPSVGSARAPVGSAPTTPPRPELPADTNHPPPGSPPEPMQIEEARAALPKIAGTVILDLKQTSDHLQVHGTWCIDGSGADDVAKQVGGWLAEAGYTQLSIRGDERKAGVSGDRGTIRLSMVVAASGAANCAAPQHYFASATIFRP